MRILAIETVETTGTVAALEGDRLLAERPLNPDQRSAQSLAPGLDALLREVGWRPADVELVSVARGPGSFTGLRIGLATAKTFAYAVGCQIVGVNTLLVIASRVPSDVQRFSVAIDAQRGELFVGQFAREAGRTLPVVQADQESANTHIVPARQWLAELPEGSVITGPGLTKIAALLPPHVKAVDRQLWAPTATAVGLVGWQLFSAGERSDPIALLPEYLRRTAAEEQWDRKQAR